jgi:hypothetical protein
LTLPNHDHPIAETAQSKSHTPVASSIVEELVSPEFSIRLGKCRLRATTVLVPEASVHEADQPMGLTYEVRTAGQVLWVAFDIDLELLEQHLDDDFRCSTGTSHAPHSLGRNFGRMNPFDGC